MSRKKRIGFEVEHVVPVWEFYDKFKAEGAIDENAKFEAFEVATKTSTGEETFLKLAKSTEAWISVLVSSVEFLECDSGNPTHAGAIFRVRGVIVLDSSHPQYQRAIDELMLEEFVDND